MRIPELGRWPRRPQRTERSITGRVARIAARLAQMLAGGTATLVRVLARVPPGVETVRAGSVATAVVLERLPDSTLRWLAAASAGLGTGFYVAGVPRPIVVASLSPALVMGAAIILRPLLATDADPGHWWSRRRQSGTT